MLKTSHFLKRFFCCLASQNPAIHGFKRSVYLFVLFLFCFSHATINCVFYVPEICHWLFLRNLILIFLCNSPSYSTSHVSVFCISNSQFLSMSVCLSVSLSFSRTLSIYISFFFSLSFSHSLSIFLSLSPPPPPNLR